MITLGKILYNIRREKGISQERLCRGLCSKGAFSKYESGERVPDWLLAQTLLQRLGKNAERLAAVVTTEEYGYICWKRNVLTAFYQGDYGQAAVFLEDPRAEKIVINHRLQQQFLKLARAVIIRRQKTDRKTEEGESFILLKEAAEITMPGISAYNMKQYLIGEGEMCILFELIKSLLQSGREEEAYHFLIEVIRYIEQYYDDDEMKAKTYPKAVLLLAPLLQKRKAITAGLFFSKRALGLLCRNGALYGLEEMIRTYLIFHRELPGTAEILCLEKQQEALRAVCKKFCTGRAADGELVVSYQNQELYLMNEVIRGARISCSMTQEELSEEICTPETLSRIENGKQTPKAQRFRALVKKTGISLDYYNGEWNTEGCCTLYNEGNTGEKDCLQACEKMMDCEGGKWRNEEFWRQFFTGNKVKAMNDIACLFQKNQQISQAIFIAEHLLEQLMNSSVELRDRYRSVCMIMENLSSWYGINGQPHKCLEICEQGIRLCLESGRIRMLPAFLVNRAEAVNEIAGYPTGESRQCLQWAYHLSRLISDPQLSSYTNGYLQIHYGCGEE